MVVGILPALETTMTVTIHAPAKGDLRDMGRIAVEGLIKEAGNKSYDSEMRERAIDCIMNYEPAYVRFSEYTDNLGTLCCKWAMGLKEGVPSLDPVIPLSGMRSVAKHMQLIWPENWQERLKRVLRNVAPANAIAQLDREILVTEMGIDPAEVDWSNEAAKKRAAKTMINMAVQS